MGTGDPVEPGGVAAVVVAPSTYTLQIADSVHLSATPVDARGNPLAGAQLEWSSGNMAVALVDAGGTVTGVGAGSAAIMARAEGRSGSAQITVSAPAPPGPCMDIASVVISPGTVTLTALDATTQLTAAAFGAAGTALTGVGMSWTSLSSTVATVGSMGLVTARNVGTALIIATAAGCSQADTLGVVVEQVVNSLTVTPRSVSVATGAYVDLHATAEDALGNLIPNANISWVSLAPSVASVNGNGRVTGLSVGTASVTAVADNRSDTATVSVTSSSPPPPPPGTGPFVRGPGANQPAGHVPIFQLITTGPEQLDVMNASGATNRQWIAANGGNPDAGTHDGTGWIDGLHTQFGRADATGVIGWPIMEWHWFPGDNPDGAAGLYSFRDWGPYTELYMREVFMIDVDFQNHKGGGTKGIRTYSGSLPRSHVLINGLGTPSFDMSFVNTFDSNGVWRSENTSLTRGVWHDLEVIWRRESTVGARDGSASVYLNGVLVSWRPLSSALNGRSIDAINHFDDNGFFSGIQISHYRGGANGDPITQESILREAEIFFSGRR